jgi:hypothetical protein
MIKGSTQTQNGKAFEYALLIAFFERLNVVTNVSVINNAPFLTAKQCFEFFSEEKQGLYNLNASFAVNFLIDLEPRLSNGISNKDILELEIASDKQGQTGDVRDILAIRSSQKWEIGISAKNNHRAVKHQRLSAELNFGREWVGINCSDDYFQSIAPIFCYLDKCKEKEILWRNIPNKQSDVYVPILQAFINEVIKLNNENPAIFPELLVKYLIGNRDFYKVIKRKNIVEIQAFNLYGTLNSPFQKIKSKHIVSKVKLPDKLIDIAFKGNSKTTINLVFNEGWQFSFRLHSAESYVIPSLKFDVNLSSTPSLLFATQLFLS